MALPFGIQGKYYKIFCGNFALTALELSYVLVSPLLLCIDIVTCADPDPPGARIPRTSQDAGQIILVHKIAVSCPAILFALLDVLLLIFSQDEFLPPSIFAATLDASLLAIGCPVGWLGNAVNITPFIELEVPLHMESEVSRGISCTRYSRECGMSTRRTKLFRGVLANPHAAVAPEDPCLEESNAREPRIEEASSVVSFVRDHRTVDSLQVYPQCDVPHGHIACDQSCLQNSLDRLRCR